MAQITISNLHIGYRGPPLLVGVQCHIDAGERIGLLGRNGSGKTTLLRLLIGTEEPDAGSISLEAGTKVALLPQDVPEGISGLVSDVIAQGLVGSNLPDWKGAQQLERLAEEMQLELPSAFDLLSSGMKRRVLLAQALVGRPDVLLLDEPTNHLDFTSTLWLEEFLSRWSGTILFVTHDRTFLRKLASRILEIDRGRLFDWTCNYDTFIQRKETALAEEEKQNALFDKNLQREETWIRQGIKARRTRNEGRVRALKMLRRKRQDRREISAPARIQIQEGQRSGALVATAKEITFSFDGQPIVDGFSTTIMRGDKVGVIGANGAGKTTLLRLLLGQLTPQRGSVRLGTNLQLAYFDQLRRQLDADASVEENVAEGASSISLGDRSKHIIGYLQDFLFSPERARMPVRFLSGGERNRVLLAKLFAKPANVLVLDEPTNDLDIETLELLEERLAAYQGAVLLVSHDRSFLNNVVTSTIVFESGQVREYVGGYDDWIRQSAARNTPPVEKQTKPKKRHSPRGQSDGTRRLSYKEQRELERLPIEIDARESEIAGLHEKMANPDFYKQSGHLVAEETARLQDCEKRLAEAYARWEELEERAHKETSL